MNELEIIKLINLTRVNKFWYIYYIHVNNKILIYIITKWITYIKIDAWGIEEKEF